MICPLHGPILRDKLSHYIEKYDIWSSYKSESEGIFIACCSIHGNTMQVAEKLKEILEEKGIKKVVLSDLAREDWAECIEDAFRYPNLILLAPTYNMEVFTPMRNFLNNLKERNYQNKKVAIIENGTWAPNSAKCMKELLDTMKNIEIVKPIITIKSTMKESNILELKNLANNFLDYITEGI